MISLKRLLLSLKPNVIIIQETICYGEKAKETFVLWIRKCSFCIFDVDGESWDLLIGWSPKFKYLTSSSFQISLSLNLRYKDNDFYFLVVNIYSPYVDRVPYS
jgi:hypothetical protein